jgi:4-aminobutyrate aminotransferase-like enzyme
MNPVREVAPKIVPDATPDPAALFAQRERERFTMHSRHLNEQMVRVLKAIGYDIGFCRGQGQYLYDRDGARYIDLLSGFGVFAVGRNHPALRQALKSVLDAELPNLVQMDVSTLAGVLAERLLAHVPYLDKWHTLEASRPGLFSQLVTIPLFKDHKILSQVASHAGHTIKLLPSLVISDADCEATLNAFAAVLADSERVPGAVWSLGKALVGNALRANA